jgi:hypothetical protein
MNLTEKASYINGLVDGMDLDTTTKEGKVIAALLGLCNDLCNAVSDLTSDVEQIYEELDAIDEDLTDVEDYIFDDEDEDEDDECDCCDCCGDEDEDVYEITCPNCGEVDYVSESELADEGLCCPKCGVKWEAEFEDEDGNPFELPDEE